MGDDAVDIVLAEPDEPPGHAFDESWWEAAGEELNRYELRNPGITTFSSFTRTSTAVDLWSRRPATKIAVGWIWKDLNQLGWVRRNRPRDLH